MDLSSLTGAVDVATVTTAIIAMGVIKMGPNVARYAVNKIVSFFR